jgi:hypothetical protein
VAGVLLGSLLVAQVHAQQLPRPKMARQQARRGVHRLEVNNGPTQMVRYYSTGLTPGETTTVREMEQLENELTYARDIQALKQQYASDERMLESHRTEVQRVLYGLDVTRSTYAAGYFGDGYGYGNFAGVPTASIAPYGYGYGLGGGALIGGGTTVNASLANGVGDEGAIKTSLARVIAQQATPEYMASLDRAYDRVATRASTSPTLRVAFDLPAADDIRRERDRIRVVEGEMTPSGPIVLTLKDGGKVIGKKMSEKGDWFIVENMSGGQTRIRQSEVTRVDVNDKSKVVPAAD